MTNEEIVDQVKKEKSLNDAKFNVRSATKFVCFYYMDVLKTEGILNGGTYNITEKGIDTSKRLIDLGFKIDRIDVGMFVLGLVDQFPKDIGMVELLGLVEMIYKMNKDGVPMFMKVYDEFKKANPVTK